MDPKAARSESRASSRLVALIVASALFMAALDASVVVVAMPDMARTFSVRPVDLNIGITIYILAQAVLLPSSSWIADRFGARRVFVLALAGFTVASVLCGFSRTLDQFIGARVLQGAAASLMTPIARIVLLKATAKEDLIGVITISTVPMLVAPTLGPPVGGFITSYLSWPWIFLLNVPVGIAGVALVLRFIPPVRGERRPFDGAGFVLLAAASGAILFGLELMSTSNGPWALGGALALAGIAFAVIAVRHLRRHPHPVLSLDAARIRTFAATSLNGGVLVRLPVRALPFILPLLFEVVLGYSAVYCGFLLLAMNGGDLLLKTAATRAMRRFGFRSVLLSSTSVMLVTVVVCAALAAASSYWVIFAVLAANGMARSLLFTGMSTLAFADVPHEELGSATVLWNLVLQGTNALGVSLAAILMNVTSWFLGEPLGHVSLRNCQVALLAMTLLGALSLVAFARLPPHAGSVVSGHRPEGRATGSPSRPDI
ncbi:MAG TPA: MFS transporter [Steroidobacteraceae bacterium]|nr:MFS transporter [Steroidobacteraceae bacterium]